MRSPSLLSVSRTCLRGSRTVLRWPFYTRSGCPVPVSAPPGSGPGRALPVERDLASQEGEAEGDAAQHQELEEDQGQELALVARGREAPVHRGPGREEERGQDAGDQVDEGRAR